MNNRYFIQIDLSCINPYNEITMLRWYDDPAKLLENMKQQFIFAVYDLAHTRGKFMKKLEKEGVDWFKENLGKLFDCTIRVIRFNHSFDNNEEFKEWLKTNNISPENDYALSGSLDERKALQTYAIDYYTDWYDTNFNKIDSRSIIYGETMDHQRTGIDLGFEVGDIITDCNCSDYEILEIPKPYSNLYWHDGCIVARDPADDEMIYEFDHPNDLKLVRKGGK